VDRAQRETGEGLPFAAMIWWLIVAHGTDSRCRRPGGYRLTTAGLPVLSRRAFVVAAAAFGLAACGPELRTVPVSGPVVVPDLTPQQMVDAINAVRKRYGSTTLAYNPTLAKVALGQARAVAAHDQLSHDFGANGTLRDRATEIGYRGPIGENLAGGQRSLQATLDGWLASPGHRYTLLSDMWTSVGMVVIAARPTSRYGIFWAADFGT
jgi:uncharacterized protein YkwD